MSGVEVKQRSWPGNSDLKSTKNRRKPTGDDSLDAVGVAEERTMRGGESRCLGTQVNGRPGKTNGYAFWRQLDSGKT